MNIRVVGLELSTTKNAVEVKYIPGNVDVPDEFINDIGGAVAFAVRYALKGPHVPFKSVDKLHVKATMNSKSTAIEFDMNADEELAGRINAALVAKAETKAPQQQQPRGPQR